MRKKGRRGRNSRRASNRRVIARETRAGRRRRHCLAAARRPSSATRGARQKWSVTQNFTFVGFLVIVITLRCGVSRGARRSDGADRSPRPPGTPVAMWETIAMWFEGCVPEPAARGRPDVIRHDVPCIDRPHDGERTTTGPRRARVRRSRTVSFPVLLTRYHSDEPLFASTVNAGCAEGGAPPVRDHRERREKSHLEANPRRSHSRRLDASLVLSRSESDLDSRARRLPRGDAFRGASRGGIPLALFPI